MVITFSKEDLVLLLLNFGKAITSISSEIEVTWGWFSAFVKPRPRTSFHQVFTPPRPLCCPEIDPQILALVPYIPEVMQQARGKKLVMGWKGQEWNL